MLKTRKTVFTLLLILSALLVSGRARAQAKGEFYAKDGTIVWVKDYEGHIAPEDMYNALSDNERLNNLWRGRSGYKYKFKLVPTRAGETGGEGELAHRPDGWRVTVRKMYAADKKLQIDEAFARYLNADGEIKGNFMKSVGRKANKDLGSVFEIAR